MAEFFMMPAASPTMKVGRLVGWSISEGDEVSFGTVLAEVETDKATAEVECFDEGVILKILRQAGDDVPVNTPIAILGASADEDISALLSEWEKGDWTGVTSEEESSAPTPEKSEKPKAGPAA